MRWQKALRHQHFHGPPDKLIACIAEYSLGLRVGKRDDSVLVHQQDRAGDGFDNGAEALLARTEPPRELRRGDEIPDQLVAHRQYDNEKAGHEDRGRVNHPCDGQRREAGGRKNAEGKTAPDESRAAARHRSTPAPQRDGGIDDERDEQQVTELRDDRPRIRDADGTGQRRRLPKAAGGPAR